MAKKPKTIHIVNPSISDCNSFKGASGTEYFIETPELQGIDRKRAFDHALTTAAFGQGVKGLIGNLLKIKDAFNKQEMAEVGHLITTQLEVAGNIQDRSDATLNACAIFINTEHEDRTKPPTDAEVVRKIQDWNDAGIPFSFFVACAGTFNDMLKALYATGSPSSPANKKERNQKGA